MMLHKLLKIIFTLVLFFSAAVGLTAINHPIILKWLSGSAKYIGTPVNATVYTNGKINKDIRVFHVDRNWDNKEKANNYLVNLKYCDSAEMLKFFNINLDEKWIGRPVGTSKNDYDFIAGHLFQSETGGHFIPFQHSIKGFNFNPQLLIAEKEIKFSFPPGILKFDSARIVFQ